jgi:hypothetical protein
VDKNWWLWYGHNGVDKFSDCPPYSLRIQGQVQKGKQLKKKRCGDRKELTKREKQLQYQQLERPRKAGTNPE